MPAVHSQRLERWLGTARIEMLSRQMRGWYGPPIALLDVPGGVKVHGDGDFSGRFERGFFVQAEDALREAWRRVLRTGRVRHGRLHTGFASISDALSEASGGKRQMLNGGMVSKVGTAPGAVGACVDLFFPATNFPTAGANAGAVAAGTAYTSASAGAYVFANPGGTDTTHLTGADFMASVALMSCLVYDRLFGVLKTASSSGAEAVTGVPTRYQGTTPGAADYIGGNFMFVSANGGALGSFAHNWTVCQYSNQSGAGTASFPSITGLNPCAQNRLDMPVGTWYAPLVSGDVGVMKITQLQCSANTVTGSANFVIGHPLGIMAFPTANYMYPFDWLTNRDQVPRIMDSACVSLLHLPCSANSATTFTGSLYATQG